MLCSPEGAMLLPTRWDVKEMLKVSKKKNRIVSYFQCRDFFYASEMYVANVAWNKTGVKKQSEKKTWNKQKE